MKLDGNLTEAHTTQCTQLCQRMGEEGCCYLSDDDGCYWKGGAHVMDDPNNGLSVNCTVTGNNYFANGIIIKTSNNYFSRRKFIK